MRHASVFSGIGGPEAAAAMLGWDNMFHCEINDFGRRVLNYWFPNSKSYEDITKTDFTEWRGQVDVLTGGFPCQPFSYAGQRRGAEDDRYLWPHMFRCIDQVRPTWVVAENVAGILTMVEQGEVSKVASPASLFAEINDVRGQYQLRETFTLQRICTDLEGHGYAVQPILIPACAVGAPHRRDRVFIVARRIASDTDNGTDGRTAREDEGKGGAQRVQERHEVRKPDEPNQVRPASGFNGEARYEEPTKGGRPSANTESNGDSRRPRQVCGEERRPSELNAESCINGEVRTSTDAGQSADTISEGLERQDEPRGGEIGEWLHIWRDVARHHRPTDEAIAGCGRWANFPSVSPVHRGNDGLPFPLDDLAIPASKWRTESIKAYGNAIVPQVMYEIFRAIEIVSTLTN